LDPSWRPPRHTEAAGRSQPSLAETAGMLTLMCWSFLTLFKVSQIPGDVIMWNCLLTHSVFNWKYNGGERRHFSSVSGRFPFCILCESMVNFM
jgi:hypothetical protein